jgi:hypothetical protein
VAVRGFVLEVFFFLVFLVGILMVHSRGVMGVLLLLGFGGLLLVLVLRDRGFSFSGVFAFAVAVGLPVRL